MHEAEYNYLLKSLEKHLEIPEDCTYADQKAIDDEVSTEKAQFSQRKASSMQTVLAIIQAVATIREVILT